MERARLSAYVFPGPNRGAPLSHMAFLELLKRMNAGDGKWIDPARGRTITPHGFRSTFRTWAEEVATFPHAIVEQAMGHQVGNEVERVYRRTDVLQKRRELMDAWAAYCEPPAGETVIPIRPRR
jgi:integrase